MCVLSLQSPRNPSCKRRAFKTELLYTLNKRNKRIHPLLKTGSTNQLAKRGARFTARTMTTTAKKPILNGEKLKVNLTVNRANSDFGDSSAKMKPIRASLMIVIIQVYFSSSKNRTQLTQKPLFRAVMKMMGQVVIKAPRPTSPHGVIQLTRMIQTVPMTKTKTEVRKAGS